MKAIPVAVIVILALAFLLWLSAKLDQMQDRYYQDQREKNHE